MEDIYSKNEALKELIKDFRRLYRFITNGLYETNSWRYFCRFLSIFPPCS